MEGTTSYSTFMSRRGEYSNGMFSEVSLPTDYQYKRIPRKNKVICKYITVNQSLSSFYYTGWDHHLVFPYKDRTFWSVWVVCEDFHAEEFIHHRVRAYPSGWVESQTNDSPKDIAKFLLINSIALHSAGEPVGRPLEDFALGIDGDWGITPGILDTNEILACILSIYSRIDVEKDFKWYTFDTRGLEEVILRNTFPEYREVVANNFIKSRSMNLRWTRI